MDSCKQHKFKGKGENYRPVINIEGAMKLIMVIPGENARAMRVQVADILSRYIHGSESLIDEIKHNRQVGPMQACSNLAQKAAATASQYIETPQISYVYASKSHAFPGLLKIGKTGDLKARLISLNTACAPLPHVIIATAPSFDNDRDEKAAQAHFSSMRRDGEFFEIGEAEVIAYFASHITARFNVEFDRNFPRT